MELKKLVEVSELLEIYGKLLTQKQRDVMHLYYNEDLSLGEMSEDLNISRQAIHDTIKKSEKLLYDYEKTLGIQYNFLQSKRNWKKILFDMRELRKTIMNGSYSASLEIIDKLIVHCEELSE